VEKSAAKRKVLGKHIQLESTEQREADLKRFKSFVSVSVSGCWIWTGGLNPKGYGYFRINGKCHLSHRVSWSLYREGDSSGMLVCHTCDTPGCVNPEHLWLGTPRQNTHDMVAKKRSTMGKKYGFENRKVKFSGEQALDMLKAHARGLSLVDAAKIHGATAHYLYQIKIGRRKRWVRDSLDEWLTNGVDRINLKGTK